LICLG